ncbi:MAG TPA: hypothetical protein VEA18_02185 [Candidatus Kapabacteria bacterium]|nr:hypothetical protein [Candidatus Kapabacteria bacterium]
MTFVQRLAKKSTLFTKHPVRFFLRQLYKMVVILPYHAVLAVRYFFKKPIQEVPPKLGTCFIITSLIYCTQKKLTYAPTRSVYGAEERYRQTLQTIESIRVRFPEATIVCIEAGLEKSPFDLEKHVDVFLYVGARPLVRYACDSRFKSLGEVIMLLTALKSIPSSQRYFKISGRYFLNDFFQRTEWEKGSIIYHFIRPDFISTRLYSFTSSAKLVWEKALWYGLPYLFLDYPVEYILARFTPSSAVTAVESVGVSGVDATNGKEVKE